MHALKATNVGRPVHVIEHDIVSQDGDEQMAQESPDAGHGVGVGIRSAGVLKLEGSGITDVTGNALM